MTDQTKALVAKSAAELMAIDSETEAQAGKIDEIIRNVPRIDLSKDGPATTGARLARAMNTIRELMPLKFIEDEIVPLQGTTLGFQTDRSSKGGKYSAVELRDVMVEAVLRGLSWIGNEINVFGGRLYATKAGVTKLVKTWPGLTNLVLTPGIPTMVSSSSGKPESAAVPFIATWTLEGEEFRIERVDKRPKGEDERIAVRFTAGMGTDAAIGKATRKMYLAIHDQLTGQADSIPSADLSEGDELPATPRREVASIDPNDVTAGTAENQGHDKTGLENLPFDQDQKAEA